MMRDGGREQKGQEMAILGIMEKVSLFAGSQRPRWELCLGSSAFRERDKKLELPIPCSQAELGNKQKSVGRMELADSGVIQT